MRLPTDPSARLVGAMLAPSTRLVGAMLALLAAVTLGWAPAFAQQATAAAFGPARVDAVEVELVADRSAIVPGEAMRLGLRIRHDPQWHTYWRNPGDSGLATQVELKLPPGFAAAPIAWPAPQRLFVPPLANFGYEGEIVLPIPLAVPASVDAERVRIDAKASWLMCREVCIPGEADVALELPVSRTGGASASNSSALFEEAARRTPDRKIAAFAASEADRLVIGLPGKPSGSSSFRIARGCCAMPTNRCCMPSAGRPAATSAQASYCG